MEAECWIPFIVHCSSQRMLRGYIELPTKNLLRTIFSNLFEASIENAQSQREHHFLVIILEKLSDVKKFS